MLDVTLLRYDGEGRPEKIFTVGLQAPIDTKKEKKERYQGRSMAMVKEWSPIKQATPQWSDLLDPVEGYLELRGIFATMVEGSPAKQTTSQWDDLLHQILG